MTPSAPSSHPPWGWVSLCEPTRQPAAARRLAQRDPAPWRVARRRADEQPPAGASVIANDIADAVNRGVKTCGPELLGKPVARGDILGGIGRAVDAGLVPPEFRQPPEVGDHALTID